MKQKVITFQGMMDFHCIADKCEDNCCKGWDVKYDQHHFEHLQSMVSGDEQQKASIEQNINLLENGTKKHFAQIRLNQNNCCSFQNASGLCNLHKDHGVEALSDTCSLFPRITSHTPTHIEVAGALSCPELARKTLLDPRPFKLTQTESSILPRLVETQEIPIEGERKLSYEGQHSKIRGSLIGIMNEESFSFSSRLFCLSNLANEISDFYYKGCLLPNSKQLKTALQLHSSRLAIQKIEKQLAQYLPSDPMPIIVIQAVLRLRLQHYPNDALSQMISRSFNYYQEKIGSTFVLEDGNMPPDLLWNAHQQDADRLYDKHREIVESVLTRYVQNCLFRDHFSKMPSLFAYLHMLSIRVAVLRFLIVGNPNILSLLDEDGDSSNTTELINQHLIEVVYKFSRYVDQNTRYLESIYYAMIDQDIMKFDLALPFIAMKGVSSDV